jgi:general secretion pathway protein D
MISVSHEGKTELQSLVERSRNMPPPGLDLPAGATLPDSLVFSNASSRAIFTAIARFSGLSIVFDPAFRDVPLTVDLRNTSLADALAAVTAGTHTFYRLTAQRTLTIVPDTPAKRREYEEAVVRTFYLSNADVKEVIDLLRIVVDIRQISAITATNAVSLKDTPERIEAAARLIAAIDKARPEVVIDVELLEVDRTRLREFGLGVASPGSPGIDGTADVNSPDLTLQGLRDLTASSVALAGVPGLYYRLLKNDANTRTLANPQLRTSDGIAAQARFGERVPIPVTTFAPIATGGINQQPITSFNYENIGVNIDILPRLHHDDEVSLTLKLALSSISGVGFGGLPTFGNREINTTIRLKDGETNILAGLIRDEERTTLAGVPGLSDLPLIGHLFANNHKETQQTDIVLTLTPHIVRVLDLSESDLRPFLMGRDSGTAPTDLPALTPRDQQGDLPMVRDPTTPPPQTPETPGFPQPLEPSAPGTATPVVPPRK